MRAGMMAALLVSAALAFALPAYAQGNRMGTDVIWARQAPGATITLDGVLDEAAWASAESKIVRYGYFVEPNGIPGSGHVEEGGKLAKDSTYATIKFLVVGSQLYMGAVVRDSSVGGGPDFNRFDGFLMALKDHASLDFPKPPVEYFYSWWYPDTCDHNPSAPGKEPDFHGRFGNRPGCTVRTPGMIAAWDAKTTVQGLSNSDATADIGYTVEMRFDLDSLGYKVTRPQGDIIEYNISIYDTDWYWPFVGARMSSNRAWWQSPWGLSVWYHQVQIHSRPDVTISSGAVPVVGPDLEIKNGAALPTPVIDGSLADAVWAVAPGFDIRYGDAALRATYPGVLKWRGGQYQPAVNGGQAFASDPGNATVKWFFKADTLYLGFDVRDKYVQYYTLVDRWDGFIVSINDRVARWRDNNLESRRLSFRVGPNGEGLAEEWLLALRDTLHGAKFGLALKANTTVDTTGDDIDQGYTAELAITLTKIGYPAGRGDGVVYIGFDVLDGDSFELDPTLSYATRTWWGRQYPHECCPAWAFMNPSSSLDVPLADQTSTQFALLGNFPNPGRMRTMIRYALDKPSRVSLEVFDLQGRRVANHVLGLQNAGAQQYSFSRAGLGTGLYLYRLRAADPATGAVRMSRSGKMMFLN